METICSEVAVQPHMRGEFTMEEVGAFLADGLPPHAWGTRQQALLAFASPRFIPTCVGNSEEAQEASNEQSVHPHMRGELGMRGPWLAVDGGSSPHAWGTPDSNTQNQP